MTESFYKGQRWLKVRARVLRHDEYLCRECKRFGKSVPASTVHHIRPRGQYPELAYDTSNLISLCTQCHNAMHDRDDNGLTARGEELAMRYRKDTKHE